MKGRIISTYLVKLQEFIIAFLLSKNIIWNLVNLSAIKSFKASQLNLSKHENDILVDIKKNGFAVTNISFFDGCNLEGIQRYKESLKPAGSKVKSFLTYFLGGDYGNSIQYFDELNPLLELSFNESLVAIINSYFEMHSRLCYLEINETKLLNKTSPEKSQNYHKDPGIKKCIKVFLYLNDVKMETGPFTYIKASHKGKEKLLSQNRFGAGGIYPKKNIFKNLVNKDCIIPICGKAGTLIFADTTGLHCGGNSIDETRKMATLVYYPPGDLKKSKIKCRIKELDSLFPVSTYLISN
jgi:hypothetical protein